MAREAGVSARFEGSSSSDPKRKPPPRAFRRPTHSGRRRISSLAAFHKFAAVQPSQGTPPPRAATKSRHRSHARARARGAGPSITNHAHSANLVPSDSVGPPGIKVFFDMPGLGSISFKYHKVLTLKEQIVFITDTRFGGPAEFYPYCSMRVNEPKKPVGVYIEGEDKLFLLDPSVSGFPIKFECAPFELCIVPLGSSKPLNSAMIKELGIVKSSEEGKTNGEASSNSEGPNSSEQPGRPQSDVDGDYESVEGGRGGVL